MQQGPKPGQVLETNSFVLGKLVESFGGVYVRNAMIRDNPDMLKQAVSNAISDDPDHADNNKIAPC